MTVVKGKELMRSQREKRIAEGSNFGCVRKQRGAKKELGSVGE